MITGATGAIGKAIARQLAEAKDSKVVMACRDPCKAERALTEIVAATDNPNVRFVLTDLSRYDDIRRLAVLGTGPLHVLINNAGHPSGNARGHRTAVCRRCVGLFQAYRRIHG